MGRDEAGYVWCDSSGKGFNRYVSFRRTFQLGSEGLEGELNLFADTRYRLTLNGVVLGHGPARFKAYAPEYDTYDLAPFLREGTNSIAVLVNSYGCGSFHSDVGPGALIAWGEARDAQNTVDLATGPSWRARECSGHVRQTIKLSFALNPGELLDARSADPDWEQPDYDDGNWAEAVPLDDMDHWGELRPRSVPPLDERPMRPVQRLRTSVGRLPRPEELYSVTVVVENPEADTDGMKATALTRIKSPRDQDVILALSEDDCWVNGEKPEPQEYHGTWLRKEFCAHLREGWNSLQVMGSIYQDTLQVMLGLPKEAGLEVSAEGGEDADSVFLTAGPWPAEMAERAETEAAALESPDDLPGDFGAWTAWRRRDGAMAPYLARAWRTNTALDDEDTSTAVDGARYAEQVGEDALVLLYDFGVERLGRPAIELTAAEGTRVDLAYSEKLRDGQPAALDTMHIRMGEGYVAREGRQRWRTFHPRGMRYLEVNVRGDLEQFQLHDLHLERANYPVRRVGRFECSDPVLNRIWQVGVDTEHACMEDAFLDCPWRERGLYAGDMLVQFYTTLAAFGDTQLMKRCIRLFFQGQAENGFLHGCSHGFSRPHHSDYSVITAMAAWAYYERTGDVDFLREIRDGVADLMQAVLSLQVEGTNLLGGEELRPYIDRQVMDRGGINCAVNCFFQHGFSVAAHIMRAVGDAGAAAEYAEHAETLARAVRAEFWDPENEVFTDRRPQDVEQATPSVASNTLPLLFEIASDEQIGGALDYIVEAMQDNIGPEDENGRPQIKVMPYFSFYSLEVLYRHGLMEEAEEFMRRNWSMMLEGGARTWWEFFSPRASWCHAWASAPTHYLSSRVLGVTFPEPGNPDVIAVDPHPGTLTWASGVYPHRRGQIQVEWELKGEHLFLEVGAPEGVEVRVPNQV